MPRLWTDTILHAADVVSALRQARQALRDAQTEALPFGPAYHAFAAAESAIDALAEIVAGQPIRRGPEASERFSA